MELLQQSTISIVLLSIIFTQITLGSINSQRQNPLSSWSSTDTRLDGLNSGGWLDMRAGHRHKRNAKEVGLYNNNNDQLSELIQENPWSILGRNEGKRQMNFTPRLGRDSGEDQASAADRWLQETYENTLNPSDMMMAQRSQFFAPRLGRRSDIHYGQYTP